MDWEQWLVFIQDRWLFLLIAAVILFLIIKFVQTLLKWLIVVIIVVVVMLYGANYTEDLKEFGSRIVEYSKEEALEIMSGELEDADYEVHSDGTFTITTNNFVMEGAADEDDVRITYRNQTITVKRTDFVERIIEQVRSGGSSP